MRIHRDGRTGTVKSFEELVKEKVIKSLIVKDSITGEEVPIPATILGISIDNIDSVGYPIDIYKDIVDNSQHTIYEIVMDINELSIGDNVRLINRKTNKQIGSTRIMSMCCDINVLGCGTDWVNIYPFMDYFVYKLKQ